MQDRLEYLDDGRTVFKLRSRLCSSLYPVNERIRDFFSEYDRRILRTSPWGNELMEVCLIGLSWVHRCAYRDCVDWA